MGLSRLKQIRSDGIRFIDQRDSLYYNKFKYRARFYCTGISIIWFCKTLDEVNQRYKSRPTRFKHAAQPTINNFFNWKLANSKLPKETRATIRMENDVAAIFSNDLNYLKTLESLGASVDYTEVDESIPEGVKYFKNEPAHKYRLHLKSKRVKDDFALKLAKWVDRYKDTDTVIKPSNALNAWLSLAKAPYTQNPYSTGNWRLQWTSSHYFIDYDDESTLTLFMLMFDSMAYKKYRLLKQP